MNKKNCFISSQIIKTQKKGLNSVLKWANRIEI